MKKDERRLVEQLACQGFTMKRTRRGHLAVSRDGAVVAVLAGTPGDWRSRRNAVAQLKRAGYRPRR